MSGREQTRNKQCVAPRERGTHPNPRVPAPSAEEQIEAQGKLNGFIQDVHKIEPEMQFIMETTVTSAADLAKVPAVQAADRRFAFQSCHLRQQAILIC